MNMQKGSGARATRCSSSSAALSFSSREAATKWSRRTATTCASARGLRLACQRPRGQPRRFYGLGWEKGQRRGNRVAEAHSLGARRRPNRVRARARPTAREHRAPPSYLLSARVRAGRAERGSPRTTGKRIQHTICPRPHPARKIQNQPGAPCIILLIALHPP